MSAPALSCCRRPLISYKSDILSDGGECVCVCAELSWAQYANSLFRCRGRWGWRDHAFDKSSIQINYPILVSRWLQFVSVIVCVCLYNKRATASMRQGISSFKGVRKVSEKSWGTNGLTPTPPPVGCCLNPGVFWELSPSVGSQRQFFQARSHQFLSEGSPSNVLPFCCAVTCVISQFIALWAGSFYHERFLSASFTLPPRLPRSHSRSLSVLLCLLLLKSYGKITALTQCGHNSQDWLSPPHL